MLSQHASVDKLSQHVFAQSQAREARHSIPECIIQTSYPSMLSPNHRPGESDILSQHAQSRQAIPACTAKYAMYNKGCKNPKQQTSWHSKIAVEPEETCTRRASRASSYNTLGG